MEQNQVQAVDTKEVSKRNTLAKSIAAGTATTFVLANSAHAAGEALAVPDMAPIVALIMGMVALVASIGMAVLSVYATGKVFKWVKAAF